MTGRPDQSAEASGMRMVMTMGLVGLLASIALVATFRFTAPYIAANRAAYLAQSLGKVLPDADHFDVFVITDSGWREGSDLDEGARVFAGYAEDSLSGLAVEAAGQGYQDVIRLLYAYRPGCECVTAITILESKETPGLGDRIETDPSFIANFEALKVAVNGEPTGVTLTRPGTKTQAWEIDAISGATVSSQAVTDILNGSTRKLVDAIVRGGLPVPSPTVPPTQ